MAPPGPYRSDAVAYGVSAVARGESSITDGPPSTMAERSRRKHRELLAQVAREHDHRVGRHGLVDGGPRQAEDHLCGEPVAQLGVDRVGAEDALGHLGPCVGPVSYTHLTLPTKRI